MGDDLKGTLLKNWHGVIFGLPTSRYKDAKMERSKVPIEKIEYCLLAHQFNYKI